MKESWRAFYISLFIAMMIMAAYLWPVWATRPSLIGGAIVNQSKKLTEGGGGHRPLGATASANNTDLLPGPETQGETNVSGSVPVISSQSKLENPLPRISSQTDLPSPPHLQSSPSHGFNYTAGSWLPALESNPIPGPSRILWITHQVQVGDTLPALARQYLGDPQRWPEIYDANRDLLSRPDILPPGARLTIPVLMAPGERPQTQN